MKKHTNQHNLFIKNPIKRKPPIKRIPQYLKYKRHFKINLLINQQRLTNKKTILRNSLLGLQAQQSGYLLLTHIDILKKFLYPKTKNTYSRSTMINLCIYLFPTRILTQKPLQSRMGRGKGLPTKWYCKVYKNELLFEFREFSNYYKCKTLIIIIIKKLPLKTCIITKKELKTSQKIYYKILNPNIIVFKPPYIA